MSSRPSRGAARLAAILDALPDGLVLVNCNGTVVNANTIALGMFETPGTALVGRGLLDLLPSFDSRLIPGSMRRPDGADERGRTKPTRMMARRTDGSEFPVEVTSASLEDGREAYDSYSGYTGDELLMLVVRDLTGTLDTEAELARSQRQTEMILRAASEGVVGTDTDGRVVLVNPAFAQILGYRAGELGGAELHPLILSKRPDGEPFPYEESPLADTLKSGRKHRVRGQVLWAKNGERVPVDLTTAPVRDGDQLVGAVMTFTDRRPYQELVDNHAAEIAALTERHATELADRAERHAAEREQAQERYAALAARHAQLTAVLDESLRGPLEELRTQLGALAADDAGQLWPEANQVLHHLAAGYSRMTALVDNVLGYQRLDAGDESLDKRVALLDRIVTAGIDAAVELIGPGRAQFAVHAPPIEAEVDAGRLTTALAHLVADVAGVDSTGQARAVGGQAGGAPQADSTIVVAAAQRGDVVRIEVRGPYAGGDPVHGPVVRGIVAAHGGVVQTHEVPGTSGGAYVLEVPLGAGRGTVPTTEPKPQPNVPGTPALPAQASATPPRGTAADAAPASAVPSPGAVPADATAATTGTGGTASGGTASGGGRRRARRASTDAFLEGAVPDTGAEPKAGAGGRRRARTEENPASPAPGGGIGAGDLIPAQQNAGLPSGAPVEPTGRRRGRPAEGSVVTAAEGAQGRAALGAAVPPQGVSAEPPSAPALARALPAVASTAPSDGEESRPTGRRRRALAAAQERAAAAEAGPRTPFALPPADADRAPEPHPPAGPVEPAGPAGPSSRAGDAVTPPVAGRPAPPAPVPPTAPVPPAGPVPPGSVPPPAAPVPPAGSVPPVAGAGEHEAVRSVPGADHTPPQPHPMPPMTPASPVPPASQAPQGPQESPVAPAPAPQPPRSLPLPPPQPQSPPPAQDEPGPQPVPGAGGRRRAVAPPAPAPSQPPGP
uniref:PAS domain-containing protein n=2 Tax=Streptomyces sp. TaxID=1931 RepID=UPI0028122910